MLTQRMNTIYYSQVQAFLRTSPLIMTQSTIEAQTPLLCLTIISKKFSVYTININKSYYIYILLYIHTIHTLHFIIHTLYYYKVLYKVSTYTLNQQAPILYRLKINRALHPNTIYKSNTIYTNIPLTNNIISTCIY